MSEVAGVLDQSEVMSLGASSTPEQDSAKLLRYGVGRDGVRFAVFAEYPEEDENGNVKDDQEFGGEAFYDLAPGEIVAHGPQEEADAADQKKGGDRGGGRDDADENYQGTD